MQKAKFIKEQKEYQETSNKNEYEHNMDLNNSLPFADMMHASGLE